MCSSTKSRGFTLIELMIALVVVAILTAIALPSYRDHVQRSKISEALTVLGEGRAKMEQWFQDNGTYVDAPCPASTQHFSISCNNPAATATTFLIRATGSDDMAAFSYGINESNEKNSTTPWAGAQGCWILRKDGTC